MVEFLGNGGSMATDEAETSGHPSSLWWYRDYERVARSEQPKLWSTWAAPISTSQCVTPEGRQVAEWAVAACPRGGRARCLDPLPGESAERQETTRAQLL